MVNLLLSILFPLVASGTAIHLEKRQVAATGGPSQAPRGGLGGLFGGISKLPKKKAIKVEEIKAKFPGAKRIKLLYGPYKLQAANSTVKLGNGQSMDKGGTGYQYMVDDDFPRDITALETFSEVVDEKFKRVDIQDGIYNHHNVFMDFASAPAPAMTCENMKPTGQPKMSVFMAGATETGYLTYAAVNNKLKSGYYLSKDRNMLNMIDVINYNNQERDVYISAEIEYLPGKPQGYLDTRQERVDPGMCGGPSGASIHPPKGVQRFTVNSTGIVMARAGYFVNIRGHLHDGGINIQLKINGKEVCDSRASYGGDGHTSKSPDGKVWETINQTSMCLEPIKVAKGDKVYMEAHYDLALHPSREQGNSGGHGNMRSVSETNLLPMDGGEAAEQMALVITHFAYTD